MARVAAFCCRDCVKTESTTRNRLFLSFADGEAGESVAAVIVSCIDVRVQDVLSAFYIRGLVLMEDGDVEVEMLHAYCVERMFAS